MVKLSSTLNATNSNLNSLVNEKIIESIGWYIQRNQFLIKNQILKESREENKHEQNNLLTQLHVQYTTRKIYFSCQQKVETIKKKSLA